MSTPRPSEQAFDSHAQDYESQLMQGLRLSGESKEFYARGRLVHLKARWRAMGRLEFSELDVEALGPEVALVRGRWRLAIPDGTRPGGLFTVIFRKLPEGWKIVHDHTSAEESKPAEPVVKAPPRDR